MISHLYSPLYRIIMLGVFAASLAAQARSPSAAAMGFVTDPTGALVVDATVELHPATSGPNIRTTTNRLGRYSIEGQADVPYILTVTASGFATFSMNDFLLSTDRPRILDVQLRIADQPQQVTVDDSQMDTDPNHNGDSLTLRGDAIDQLPLDSVQLLQQLQALSGGPSPDLFIDGFPGSTMPPRDTIREIRINQNPYSAQYDTSPGNGRIEVFTKPGSAKFHGDFYTFGNASALNTQNPFTTNPPSYYSFANYASLNGPLTKHSAFFVSGGHIRGQDNALINAQTLDGNFNQVYLHQTVSAPASGYNFSARMDAAIGAKSSFVGRYSIAHSGQTNAGIGQLSLASLGFNGSTTNQTLQLSNSLIVSPRIVNDTRFQFVRSRDRQTPDSFLPTVNVAGAFSSGGNSGANYNDNQDRFELQNYISASKRKQFFTFGVRLRIGRDANHSEANYNGTYTFASLVLNPSCTPLSTCNSYQVTVQNPTKSIAALQLVGGGPSQFTISKGNPNVAVTMVDVGLFLQDDWKARSNLTLSGGLRFETQNHIADYADLAPRFGFAWLVRPSKNKPVNYTLRGGAGIFYYRLASSNVLQSERQNGITQQQFIVTQPQFFDPTSSQANLTGAQTQSAIYQISPKFHAPYFLSTTVSLERRIGGHGSVTVSWLGTRGVHTLLTQNTNAPLPGTYNSSVPTSGTRPFGGTQNIYQYASEGDLNSKRLTTNFYLHFTNKLLLYGYYQLQSVRTNSDSGFVSNSYNFAADYGRSGGDIRHQVSMGSALELPFRLRATSFITARSGAPFNIVVGQDLNGDSIFNDRPAFATDMARSSVVSTKYGSFDTSPIAGQTIIPVNYGRSPSLFVVNLNLNKTIGFGPALKPLAGAPVAKLATGQKPHVDHQFSLDIGLDAQNLFNQVNLASPVGTLNSPLFGQSIALATGNGTGSANRVIEISTFLRF